MTQWSNKHHGAWIDELSQDGKDYTTASGTARHKLPASFSQGLACRRPSHWKHVKIPCSGKVANHLLKSLSQRYGVSQSTVLVTAVLLLLGRYHAIEEVGVLVGTAADNANLERPVLTKATSGRQIRDLVADVSGQIDVPHSHTTQRQPTSAAGLLPCFVAFGKASDDNGPSRKVKQFPVDAVLGVECRYGARKHRIRLYYRTRAHAGWLAKQFGRHLANLIAVWFAEPDMTIDHLGLLEDAEITSLRSHCKGETRDYPLDKPLYRLFSEQAAHTPQRVALIGRERNGALVRLSYQEVEARVSHLARRLASLSVAPGMAVGVYLERTIDLIPALLAVLRVGGIYVPLDRSYPDDYLRFILEDTQAPLLITDQAIGERELSPGIRVMRLDEAEEGNITYSFADASTTAPCLIMYTSGSTGRPKGVVHCQRQIINRLHWMWEVYPFCQGDVIAQRSPINVMPSIWELLGGLLAGVPTVVIPDTVLQDPCELAGFLAGHEITFITLTPTVLRQLLSAREQASAWPQSLRVVIIGGEPLTDDLYREFRGAFPSTTMINDFGATEVNTVLHTALRPTLHISAEGRGYRPIANVSAFILDDSLRLVPFGVHGELCIAGASVALSYLNLPDVTAERFVTAQPTGSGLAMRLYRTGEMGYMTPDGGFHITGRRDHQVKVNGMRVELGEVEEVLRRHPAVAECAVIDRLAFHHHRVLHAYVVPRADRVIELSDLQMYLRKRLLPYMVPVHIEWLDALPRRPNGKLDRAALRDRAPLSIPAEAHADTAADTIASIIRIVREAAAAVLGVGPESVDTYREFRALGLDSVASVDFANYLATKLHRPLSPIKLFEYPTIARLTDYLVRTTPLDANRSDWTALGEGQDTPASPQGTDSSTDIAIIGMSGRFPGADDIGKFWDNLRAGAENIGTIAPDRWDPASIYDPDPARERRSYSKWGGFLADVAEFDPLFFGLSPAEARAMDPQQRLCLMESWHALEDACYTGIGLDEQTVGVFVGARESDYPTLIARAGWAPDANTMLGNDLALLAARISYFCDLRGPSLVVDTACSSALVALHLACRSLLDGECTMALAGGVCVTDDPDFYVATSKLSIFSPTGHCRAFDEGADGFVHGEGVGFVVLKPLRRAIADNDHIYAVIRGTAINQDGRSNGITAPNGEAQTTLQAALYRRLTINPETISYVEAHGTGTRLGDPVEVQALTRSFRQFTQRRQYCALGSVKTNIGHLTAAAGIASLIKAILCLYHRELVPSLHFSHPNALIEFEESPFYVSTRCCAWETLPGQVRRAAVNSFGIGGTNVHCVLEEAPAPNPVGVLDEPAYLVPVTATDPEALARAVGTLSRWVETRGRRQSFRDLSYSLLIGRRLFEHGYVFIARDMEEFSVQLRDALSGTLPPMATLLDGRAPVEGTWELTGTLQAIAPLSDEYLSNLLRIAEQIARGQRTDWRPLYGGELPRRIPVPTYPFAKQRYWIETLPSDQAHVTSKAPEASSVTQAIVGCVSAVLGIDPTIISREQPLSRYGIDSLKALTLKHSLERMLGISVPLQSFLDGSCIRDIAHSLAETRTNSQLQDVSKNSDDRLIERFLNGAFDLRDATDEQLDHLFQRLSETVEVVDAS